MSGKQLPTFADKTNALSDFERFGNQGPRAPFTKKEKIKNWLAVLSIFIAYLLLVVPAFIFDILNAEITPAMLEIANFFSTWVPMIDRVAKAHVRPDYARIYLTWIWALSGMYFFIFNFMIFVVVFANAHQNLPNWIPSRTEMSARSLPTVLGAIWACHMILVMPDGLHAFLPTFSSEHLRGQMEVNRFYLRMYGSPLRMAIFQPIATCIFWMILAGLFLPGLIAASARLAMFIRRRA